MKKILFLFLLLPSALCAQVSFISVTGVGEYTSARDFDKHTYEIRVTGGGKSGKCQAVRIQKNYFLTAAHCVAEFCSGGACRVQTVLLANDLYEALSVTEHTNKNKTVFFDKSYDGSLQKMGVDIAVLKYDSAALPVYFYSKKSKKWHNAETLPQESGNANTLIRTARSRHTAAPDFPLIHFSNNYYKLNRVLSFLSIEGGQKNVRTSGDYVNDSDGDKNPAYFLKNMQAVMVLNFGSYKGMSGSGIMTNTGELLGINSAISYYEYYENGVRRRMEYSGFATFNDKTLELLKSAMGAHYDRLSIVHADNGYAKEISFSRMPRSLQLYIKNYEKTHASK